MNCSTIVGGKIACKRPAKFEICVAVSQNKAENIISKHCDEHAPRIFADYLAFGDRSKSMAVRTL